LHADLSFTYKLVFGLLNTNVADFFSQFEAVIVKNFLPGCKWSSI